MLSNYTIKQMLPRLVVAAVLINISYWVCALAVDVSNLLGKSLYGLLAGLAPMHLDSGAIVALVQVIVSGGALAGGTVLAGGGILSLVGTTATALFAAVSGQLTVGVILLFVSLLLGAFAAIFVGLFILAARQALVIILIVVSPIAFALYILPGTKKLFDKWQKLFTTMLIFFPLFAVLYGGAQLAASILISQSAGAEGGLLKGVFLFIGFSIQFVPLFFTWFLLTKATGFIGDMGSKALQRVNSLARDPLRSAAGKQFRSAGATTGAHIGGSFLRRGFSSGTRRGRAMQRLQRAVAGAGLSRAAEEAEFQEAKQSTIESDHRLSALHERASNAKERTEGVEAKMETARLETREGIAARHARDNAKKLQTAQENKVEGARNLTFAGQAANDAAKNSEEDLKAAQGISEIRRMRTAAGAQATQNRKNVEGYVQGTEASVERRRLASPEGQRSYEFQKNAEGRLETQQHASETLRLGTDDGKAVEFDKEDAAGELKIAQNDVKTERLQTRAVSRAIEHGVGNSSDILKAAQNKVETGRIATPQGQAAFEVLKNSEDKLTGQQNDSEAIRLTTDEGKASFKVREDSASNLKVAQSQAGQTRLQDAGSRRIEQAAKNAEDWLKAEQSDVETERIQDDVNGGRQAAYAAKSAEVTRSSAATKLDAEHIKDNDGLYVEQAASNEELAEAKSDLEQQVAGYRTDEGRDAELAKNNGLVTAGTISEAAERINRAAKEKSLSDSAAQGAQRQYTKEEAERIRDNDKIAERAAGLDPGGKLRAQAIAKEQIISQTNAAIAQEKTTMSKLKHDGPNPALPPGPENRGLMEILKDSSEPAERRAAAAGMIAASGWRDGQLEMLEYITDAANMSEDMSDIQQQALKDMGGDIPTALGDTMKNALRNGDLTIDPRTVKGRNGADITLNGREEMILQRLEAEKFSENSLASLNPDEVKIIDELYKKGVLDPNAPGYNKTATDHLASVLGRLRKPGNTSYAPTKDAQRNVYDKVIPPPSTASSTSTQAAQPKPRTGTRAGTPVPDSTAGTFTQGYSQNDIAQMDEAGISSFISTAGGVQNLSDDDIDKLYMGTNATSNLGHTLRDEWTRRGF